MRECEELFRMQIFIAEIEEYSLLVASSFRVFLNMESPHSVDAESA